MTISVPMERTCPNRECGEAVDWSMDHCANCGEPLETEPPEPEDAIDFDGLPGGADCY
jgi:hypothetical protein